MATFTSRSGNLTVTTSGTPVSAQTVMGEWFLVGPVTFTGKTPAYDSVNQKHGYQRGPVISTSDQRWDGDMFNSNFIEPEAWPITLQPGETLVICESVANWAGNDNPHIEEFMYISVVDAIPAGNFYRPSIIQSVNDIYSADGLNTSFLKNITLPQNLADIAAGYNYSYYEYPWTEFKTNWTGRYRHARRNQPTYGQDLAHVAVHAYFMINLSNCDAILAAAGSSLTKQDLIHWVIQYGIDCYACIKAGSSFFADGGHNNGRWLGVLIAGLALGEQEMIDSCKGAANKYSEMMQPFRVIQADINITNEPEHPLGAWEPDDRDPNRTAIPPEWLGKAAWSAAQKPLELGSIRSTASGSWHQYYNQVSGSALHPQLMVARMMELESIVEADYAFEYLNVYFALEWPPGKSTQDGLDDLAAMEAATTASHITPTYYIGSRGTGGNAIPTLIGSTYESYEPFSASLGVPTVTLDPFFEEPDRATVYALNRRITLTHVMRTFPPMWESGTAASYGISPLTGLVYDQFDIHNYDLTKRSTGTIFAATAAGFTSTGGQLGALAVANGLTFEVSGFNNSALNTYYKIASQPDSNTWTTTPAPSATELAGANVTIKVYLDLDGYAGRGGFITQRPITKRIHNLTDSTRHQEDVNEEVARIAEAGFDGVALDILHQTTHSDFTGYRRWFRAAVARTDFKITIMPDMTGLTTASGGAANLPTIIRELVAEGGYQTLEFKNEERVVIAPWTAENQTESFWVSLFETLESVDGIKCVMVACCQGSTSYFATWSQANIDAWVMAGGEWGSRYYGYSKVVDNTQYALDDRYNLKFMQPISTHHYARRSNNYTAPENPDQTAYPGGFDLILGFMDTAFEEKPKFIQQATYNDYSEGNEMRPSQKTGWVLHDLFKYFNNSYKMGYWLPITKDAIFYAHRQQFLDADLVPASPQTTKITPHASSSPVDTIQMLAFLTAPATMRIKINGNVYEREVKAGRQVFNAPLDYGRPEFEIIRDNIIVKQLKSRSSVKPGPFLKQDLIHHLGSTQEIEEGRDMSWAWHGVTPDTYSTTPNVIDDPSKVDNRVPRTVPKLEVQQTVTVGAPLNSTIEIPVVIYDIDDGLELTATEGKLSNDGVARVDTLNYTPGTTKGYITVTTGGTNQANYSGTFTVNGVSASVTLTTEKAQEVTIVEVGGGRRGVFRNVFGG